MKRFVEGEDRSQSTLFPERLDDYIGAVQLVQIPINTLLDLRQAAFHLGSREVPLTAVNRLELGPINRHACRGE